MRKKIDLTGQRFGRLVVVEDTHERYRGKVIWKCLCDCGNETNVTSSNLTHKNTTSCSCYRNERIKEAAQSEEHKERARKLSLNYLKKGMNQS